MTALAAIPADALTTLDLAWLARLIVVFVDDVEYRIDPMHIRSAWQELADQDAGHGTVHFDTRAEELKARRERGAGE